MSASHSTIYLFIFLTGLQEEHFWHLNILKRSQFYPKP